MRWRAPKVRADFFPISGKRRDGVGCRGSSGVGAEPARNPGVCPRQRPRRAAGDSEERMKPLRWSVVAVIAGSVGFLASPGSASAALSHRPTSTAAFSIQGMRTPLTQAAQNSHGSKRSPVRPSNPARPVNRAKTRHPGTNNRLRWHSLDGVVPFAAAIRPDDNPGTLDHGFLAGQSARLNRMLESRGPPRAGPPEKPALRAPLPPIPAHLSSSVHISSTTPTPRLTPVRTIGPPFAVRFEGTAAGLVTPSPGGSPI